MTGLARNTLWNIAELQHGFVTAQQAAEVSVSKQAVQMLIAAPWSARPMGCTASHATR